MAVSARDRKRNQRARAEGYGKSRRVGWDMQHIDKSFTYVMYLEMIIEQGGKCAMPGCESPIDNHSPLDHDHATGEVRAVLCSDCNLKLGIVESLRTFGGASFIDATCEYLAACKG